MQRLAHHTCGGVKKGAKIVTKGRIVIPIIVILALTITAHTKIYAYTTEDCIEQAEKELIGILPTLDSIKSAANDTLLESLSAQLNEALVLLEKAEQYVSKGRTTEANAYAEEALSLIKKAKGDAESIVEASSQTTLQIQVLSWSLVPVASFLTALVTTRGYEWYAKHERRKLLNMAITRRKKKAKK